MDALVRKHKSNSKKQCTNLQSWTIRNGSKQTSFAKSRPSSIEKLLRLSVNKIVCRGKSTVSKSGSLMPFRRKADQVLKSHSVTIAQVK